MGNKVIVEVQNSRLEALKEGYAHESRDVEVDLSELTDRQRECLGHLEYDYEEKKYRAPQWWDASRHYDHPTIVTPDFAAVLKILEAVDNKLQKEQEEQHKKEAEEEQRVRQFLNMDVEDLVERDFMGRWTVVNLPNDERLDTLREAARDLAAEKQRHADECERKAEEAERAAEARARLARMEYVEQVLEEHGSLELKEMAKRGYQIEGKVRKLVRDRLLSPLEGYMKFRRVSRRKVCHFHPEEVSFRKYTDEDISEEEMRTILDVEKKIPNSEIEVQHRWASCDVCYESDPVVSRALRVTVQTPLGPVGRTYLLEDGKLVPSS